MNILKKNGLLILISLVVGISLITAQGTEATVPDLTGLALPQAASLLNSAGLNLGTELAVDWAASSPQPENTIATQSVPANTSVARGTSIDVEVFRTANMVLIYDDNDLTLVNTTLNVADMTGLRFAAIEGSPASFAAARWSSNMDEKNCAQIWSIPRGQSKSLSECDNVQNWLTTNTVGEHFWTQTSGVQQFAVVDEGVQRITCPAAGDGTQDSPLRCAFYADGANAGEGTTFFYYLAYTTDALILFNPTQDKWMPTDRTTIYGANATSAPAVLGETTIWGDADFEVEIGDLTRLAPQQCLLLTTDVAADSPAPEDCTVIAQQAVNAQTSFWLNEFEVESANDGQLHKCPAALPDRLTRCIVPQ